MSFGSDGLHLSTRLLVTRHTKEDGIPETERRICDEALEVVGGQELVLVERVLERGILTLSRGVVGCVTVTSRLLIGISHKFIYHSVGQ